jgi:hypothetical protein
MRHMPWLHKNLGRRHGSQERLLDGVDIGAAERKALWSRVSFVSSR